MDARGYEHRLNQLEADIARLQRRLEEQEGASRAARQGLFALQKELAALRSMPPPDAALEPGLEVPILPATPPPVPEVSVPRRFSPGSPAPAPRPATPRRPKRQIPWDRFRNRVLDFIGRPPEGENWEVVLGTFWLPRLGLLAVVIGLGFLARYYGGAIGPVGRVLLGYGLAVAIGAAGVSFGRKLELFGRTLVAGALSIGFFVSFAAHFLVGMHCMPLLPSVLLMAVFVGVVFASAERWRSQIVGALAALLGEVAVYVSAGEAGLHALPAVLILAAVVLVLQLRHRWFSLGLFGLIASYVTLLAGMFQVPVAADPLAHFWLNLLYVCAVYGIFLGAHLLGALRQGGEGAERHALSAIGVLNPLFCFGLGLLVFSQAPEGAPELHLFLFPLAVVQGGVAALLRRGRRVDAFFVALAVLIAVLGAFSAWDGATRTAVIASFALALLLVGRSLRMPIFSPLAQVVLLTSFGDFIHFRTGLSEPAPAEDWGGLFVVAVYLVKSGLQSTHTLPDEERSLVPRLLHGFSMCAAWLNAVLASFMLPVLLFSLLEPVPATHALAGAALIIWAAGTALRAESVAGAGVLSLLIAHMAATVQTLMGRPWNLPWEGWLPAAAVSLVIVGYLALLPRKGMRELVLELAATAVALGSLLFSTVLMVGHVGAGQWEALRAIAIGVAGVLVLAAAHLRGQREGDLERTVGYAIAVVGVCLASTALAAALPWAHVLLVLSLLVPAFLALGRVSRVAPAASAVSLLIAFFVYLLVLGPWEASEQHSLPVLVFWLVLAVGALFVSRQDVGEQIAGAFASCVSGIILVLLVHAQVQGAWGYALLTLAGLALLLLGLARRAPAFAASSLLCALAAPVLFHWDWAMQQLAGNGFVDLVLPAFLAGLALAFWERLALARWRDTVVPGAADLQLLPEPRAGQYVLVAVITVFGVSVAYVSELFGMSVLSVGWTLVASLLLGFGFMAHAATYRRYGMGLLAVVIVRVLVIDTANLETPVKIVAWLGLGAALLGFGFMYAQYKDRLARWL